MKDTGVLQGTQKCSDFIKVKGSKQRMMNLGAVWFIASVCASPGPQSWD